MCNSTVTKFIDAGTGKKLREKTDFLFSNIDICLICNKFKFFAFARNFIDISLISVEVERGGRIVNQDVSICFQS